MTTAITASDEQRHAPEGHELWSESWYFDVAAPDGSLAAFVRLALHPAEERASCWTYVVGQDRPVVSLRDEHLPLPDAGAELAARSDDLRVSLQCDRPLGRWLVEVEGCGHIPMRLDVEWTATSPVHGYGVTTRYEQAGTVRGRVRLGDEELPLDGPGQRDHSWGIRDWWVLPWTWTAGRLDDGTAFHAAGTHNGDLALWQEGFVAAPEGDLAAAARFAVTTVDDPGGRPSSGSYTVGDLDVAFEVVALTRLALTAPDGRVSELHRGLCRYTSSTGVTGVGWSEWNRPLR